MSATSSQPKLRVIQTRKLPPNAQKYLESQTSLDLITFPHDTPCPREWLLSHIPNAHGLICIFTDSIDSELVNVAGSNLKCVSSMSAGYDHVSLPALKAAGIRLGLTPDALTDSVADIGIFLTLGAMRRAKECVQIVQEGRWPEMPWSPTLLCGPSLAGKTVGFLGFGKINQAIAKRLQAFGVNKIIYSTSKPGQSATNDWVGVLDTAEAVHLQRLRQESDVLVIGCTLNDQTKNLVDKQWLREMKKTSVLVNIARGGVVDSDALAQALLDGEIYAAGLDVIAGEPNIPADHALVKSPKCFLLPHIGSATTETREAMAMHCVLNLLAGLGLRKEMIFEQKM